MKRILQFPKIPALEKMGDQILRDASDDYFDIIRSWIQNGDTARFYLNDLISKGKVVKGSQTYLNLLRAKQLDQRLRNLATPGIQSPMGHDLVLQAEVKFENF